MIGNSDYAHASRPANPLNDAADMGAAPARPGFDVTSLENTDEEALENGLQEFRRAVAGTESAALAEQSAARAAYEAAEKLGTPEAFEVVIRHFPDSAYADLARLQIARLKAPEAVENALDLETDDYELVRFALDAEAFRLDGIDGKFRATKPRRPEAVAGRQRLSGHRVSDGGATGGLAGEG